MEIDFKLIGERIKKARKSKGWSQELLSEKMDISVAYLSRVERGSSEINLKRLVQVSKYLDISMDYLLTGSVKTEKNYLDKEMSDILKNCKCNEQRLIYDIAKLVSEAEFF